MGPEEDVSGSGRGNWTKTVWEEQWRLVFFPAPGCASKEGTFVPVFAVRYPNIYIYICVCVCVHDVLPVEYACSLHGVVCFLLSCFPPTTKTHV